MGKALEDFWKTNTRMHEEIRRWPSWKFTERDWAPGEKEAWDIQAAKLRAQDELADHLRWRGVVMRLDDVCPTCSGRGARAYHTRRTWQDTQNGWGRGHTSGDECKACEGSGSTLRVVDVCDSCWGSGSKSKPWANLHKVMHANNIVERHEALGVIEEKK